MNLTIRADTVSESERALNSMINWREKFVAFGIHFAVTLAVALAAAALIFLVWFPNPFQEMVGGYKLFALLVGCDIVLGPLVSLIIYNSKKSRRALVFDYSLVGAVQLAAMIYGLTVSFESRPVYVAFVHDRMEVITAKEIADKDLADARSPEYQTLPIWGPRLIGTQVKPEDHNDAVEGGIEGRDISARPKFFVPYDAIQSELKARTKPLSELRAKHPELDLDDAAASVRWLPVKHKSGFWTAIVDANTGRPIKYLSIDPY